MKKSYIIGGVVGVIAIIAIILCVVIVKKVSKKAEFIPTIAKIEKLDENGNVVEASEKIKLEGEDKTKIEEYANTIKDTAQKERYSMIIFSDYNIRINEHISLRIKENIKEYVYYVDDTKEGAEKEIVTRAPDGFVEWVMSKVNPNINKEENNQKNEQ